MKYQVFPGFVECIGDVVTGGKLWVHESVMGYGWCKKKKILMHDAFIMKYCIASLRSAR